MAQADGRPMEIIVVDDRSQRRFVRGAARGLPTSGRCGSCRARAAARRRRSTPACARRGFRSSARSIRTSSRPGWMQRAAPKRSTIPRSAPCRVTTPAIPTRRCARARWGSTSSSATRRSRDATPPRLHRQLRLSRRGASQGRPVRRDARLRLRQRPELPAARRRLSADLLPRRAERAPLARRVGRLPRPAVRIRLRPPRSRGQASAACRRRLGVAGWNDVAPGADGDRRPGD